MIYFIAQTLIYKIISYIFIYICISQSSLIHLKLPIVTIQNYW